MDATKSRINASKTFRESNTVFIGPPSPDLDLERELNKYTHKTIYLREGDYVSYNINITTNNITIKPASGARVRLDGYGSTYVIGLDNASNVSIQDLEIFNGSVGIAIESSNYCEIKKINITDLSTFPDYEFDHSGLVICNSSYNVICNNKIGSTTNDKWHGIWLYNSNKNIIQNNDINVSDIRYYYYKLDRSNSNLIIIPDKYLLSGKITVCDNENNYRLYKSDILIAISDDQITEYLEYSSNQWVCIR